MRKQNLDWIKELGKGAVKLQSIQNKLLEKINLDLTKKLENHLIEGLKRKGYVFDNENELKDFVKEHCMVTDSLNFKKRIYYAKGVPFFLHNYEVIIDNSDLQSRSIVFKTNFGTFAYL